MSFANKIVTTYAKSLIQNGNSYISLKKDELYNVETITSSSDQKVFSPDIFILGEELLLLRSIIISSKKTKDFFKNPTYLEQQKLEILLNVFPGLTLTMKSFLKVLTERSHLSLIPEISEEYNTVLGKIKNLTKVKLIVASALDDNFGNNLLRSLKKVTKSDEIILTIAYNPQLLGGLILEYNSVAIDASILKEFSLFFTEI
jgi:ATP synthase F1 delta subunit